MARNLNRDPDHLYTIEEHFALEKASERRYEYWDGKIVCMSGGTLAHGQITRNSFLTIARNLGARNCQAFTGVMAIKTPSLGYYRYPDVSVVCGDVEIEQINGIDVVSQNIPHITHYWREHDQWRRADYSGSTATIPSPSISAVLTLGDIYQDVRFE